MILMVVPVDQYDDSEWYDECEDDVLDNDDSNGAFFIHLLQHAVHNKRYADAFEWNGIHQVIVASHIDFDWTKAQLNFHIHGRFQFQLRV